MARFRDDITGFSEEIFWAYGSEDGQRLLFGPQIAETNFYIDPVTLSVLTSGSTPDKPIVYEPPVFAAPVAADDDFTTTESATVNGDVLADNGNGVDFDADGDPLTVVEVNGTLANVNVSTAGTGGGFFTITSTGDVTFDPAGQFEDLAFGEQVFTSVNYTVSDNLGGSSTATVNVTVTGENDAPAANDDFLATTNTSPLFGSLFDENNGPTDEDIDGDSIMIASVNGSAANVGISIAGDNGGTFLVYGFGMYLFDPGADFNGLGVGATADTSITYTITDPMGLSSTATATVTVFNPADNIDPVARFDEVETNAVTIINGNVFFDNGGGADSDANGDTLTVFSVDGDPANIGSVVAGTNGGEFTINGDGTFTFDPGTAFLGLFGDETDDTGIEISVSDGNGGFSDAFVSVVVRSSSAPLDPVARDDELATDASVTIMGDVFADNGNGPDGHPLGSAFFVQEVNGVSTNVGSAVAGSGGGLFTVLNDGSYTFDPNGDFSSLSPGEMALTTINYVIFDGNFLSESALVTVVVTGEANADPVAADDAFTTDEDNAVGGNVFADNGSGADEDPDGDTLTVVEVGGVAGAVGMATAGSNGGLFTVNVNGVFSFQPNGDFDSLAVGESAMSTIAYTVSDGNGGTDTATITQTITGINDDPFILIDGITANATEDDAAFNFDLLTSAGDVDTSDTINVSGLTLASGDDSGITINGNDIDVDPNAYNALGMSEFETIVYNYNIVDGNGGTVSQTATITISGINDDPIANDDNFTTDEDNAVGGNVFNDNDNGADSDADGDTLTVIEVDGIPGNVGVLTTGSNGGRFIIDALGVFSFQPNGDFDILSVGEMGTSSITYAVSDGNGGVATATITQTITGVNDDPFTLSTLDFIFTEDDTVTTVDLLDLSGDVDQSDTLDVANFTLVSGNADGISLSSSTMLEIDPTTYDYLAVGETENVDYSYDIIDNNGGSASQTATVTINGVNDGPVAFDDGFATNSTTLATGNIFADNGNGADSDPDTSDTLTVTAVDTSSNELPGGKGVTVQDIPNNAVGAPTAGSNGGLFTIDANGDLSFDPNGDFNGLTGVQTADTSIQYTISDGNGGIAMATATITVSATPAVNSNPVAQDDDLVTDSDTSISGSVFDDNGNGNDDDADGDVITVTNVNNSASDVGGPVTGDNGGTFVINSNGAYTFDPSGDFDSVPAGQTVTTSVTYDIGDGNGGSDQAIVTVTITGANNLPIAQDDDLVTDTATTITGSVFSDNGNGIDSDPDGDTITVTDVNNSASDVGGSVAGDNGGVFVINSNGTYSFDPNGDFAGLPAGQSATTQVNYDISDANGGFAQAVVTVTVNGLNPLDTPPVAQNDAFTTTESADFGGSVFADNGNGADTDAEGDAFTVRHVNGNGANVGMQVTGDNGGNFIIGSNGALNFDPAGGFEDLGVGQSRTTSVTYDVVQANGTVSNQATVSVTVTGENDGPNARNDAFTTDANVSTNGNVFLDNGEGVDLDIDGDNITVSGVNNMTALVGQSVAGTNGGSFVIESNGDLSFDPGGDFDGLLAGQSATTSINYEVADGQGGFDTAVVIVSVDGIGAADTAPTAQDDSITTTESADLGGNVFADNGNGADTDAEGDAFTVRHVNGNGANVGMQVTGDNGGNFIIGSNGALNFDPAGGFEDLGVGQSRTTSVTYDVVQANGTVSNQATVSITVTGENDGPNARNDAFTTDANVSTNGNVFLDNGEGVDLDIDGDNIAVSGVNNMTALVGQSVAGTNGGSFVIASNGDLSFDPGGDFDGLLAGQSTTTSINYELADGQGGFDTAVVIVTVDGIGAANTAPDPQPDSFTTTESADIGGNVFDDNGNGVDSDAQGDSFTVGQVNSNAANVGMQVTGNNGGVFVIGSNGALNFDPAGGFEDLGVGQSRTTTVTYNLVQADGVASGRAVVSVTVNGENDGPDARDDDFSTDANETTDGNVFDDNGEGDDSDIDGDALVVAGVNNMTALVGQSVAGSNGGSFIIEANGDLSFNPGGSFDGLSAGQTTTTAVTYEVSDGEGGFDTATATVTVTGIDTNDAPNANDDQIDGSAGNTTFDLFADNGTGADTDPDGDTLTITSIDGQNVSAGDVITFESGLSVTFAGMGGQITLAGANPGAAFANFDYTVSDGNGGTDTANVDAVFSIDSIGLADSDVILTGADAGDQAGRAVSNAGDVNDDGVDDFLIGARFANDGAGETYVIFGSEQSLASTIDLGNLDGSNGFLVTGANSGDESGRSVAAAGDVNGDGVDDFIVGAIYADSNGNADAGAAYVVFGNDNGFGASLDLGSLNGSNGFSIRGIDAGDQAGTSVASAGDVNGDGFDDLVVGAIGADVGGGSFAGEAYLIFGGAGGFNGNFDLSTLNGSNGFMMTGTGAAAFAGVSVSGGGDFNDDGFDDVLVSANGANGNTGQAYVVFGAASGFAPSLNLAALDAADGAVFNGPSNNDRAGESIDNAGDVNGDGIDDIIIGAMGADGFTGESYVVFGSATGFASSFALSSLDGSNGFTLRGDSGSDLTGFDVAGAGDFNGDGVDDMLVSALFADPGGSNNAGTTYLIFGNNEGFPSSIELANLDGNDGFMITGIDTGDNSGSSVSAAGDVNGDGHDDLLIGARNASGGEGEVYVLFGYDSDAVNNNTAEDPSKESGADDIELFDTAMDAEIAFLDHVTSFSTVDTVDSGFEMLDFAGLYDDIDLVLP